MKQQITTKAILIAAFIVFFIRTALAQHSLPVSYSVDVTASQGKPLAHPLFDNEKDAESFTDSLISGLTKGTIKGYESADDKKPLSIADITNRFLLTDTVTTINPVTLIEDTKIISAYKSIGRIKFYEDWSMDKAGNIAKRVKAYTLQWASFDLSGNFRDYVNIVTIKSMSR